MMSLLGNKHIQYCDNRQLMMPPNYEQVSIFSKSWFHILQFLEMMLQISSHPSMIITSFVLPFWLAIFRQKDIVTQVIPIKPHVIHLHSLGFLIWSNNFSTASNTKMPNWPDCSNRGTAFPTNSSYDSNTIAMISRLRQNGPRLSFHSEIRLCNATKAWLGPTLCFCFPSWSRKLSKTSRRSKAF